MLAYLFEIMRANDNLIIAMYEQIVKGVGTSERTVYMLMQKLMKANVIRKQSNGVYMMNPKCMIKGDESKRQLLVNYYVDSILDEDEFDAVVEGEIDIDDDNREVLELKTYKEIYKNKGRTYESCLCFYLNILKCLNASMISYSFSGVQFGTLSPSLPLL